MSAAAAAAAVRGHLTGNTRLEKNHGLRVVVVGLVMVVLAPEVRAVAVERAVAVTAVAV